MTTGLGETETLAEKRRRLKAEREEEAANQETDPQGDAQPGDLTDAPSQDDFGDGPNRTAPTPDDVNAPEPQEDDPDGPDQPAMPVNAGRSSAGSSPQTQMDEIVLPAEAHLDLLADLEMMERWHQAHLSFAKAQRSARKAFEDLGMYDGNEHAYRLRDFRIVQVEPSGEDKAISFTRHPTQKVYINRDTE